MDFQRFGIDPRLAQAADGLPTSYFFYEKMLIHAVQMQENVCAKIALDAGREEVLLLPALQWLLTGDARKLLVVSQDAAGVERCAAAIGRLGTSAGVSLCKAARDEAGAEPRLEGEPSAPVLVGTLDDLITLSTVNLREYGFLVVDGVEGLAELPLDSIRKFNALLLPSWERRSVLACSKFSIKVKNLAWDLADNPSEITIEGEVAKAQSVLKETWKVPVESKFVFLLGLIARDKPQRLCVFCNLRDTALDVTRRLAGNGIAVDSILGPLPPERQFALIEKFRAGDSTCLVLSDEGAEGLTPGVFPLIVNYDIPLEPEFFVKRLEMLDRSDPAAKVVSIACDRYIYGLPAVEQYIDAKLDAVPADETLLSAVDRSGAKVADRRPREEGFPRDGRRPQPQRRDAYPREGRGNPDIRKSISEATGGTLDMSGNLPMERPGQRPSPERQQSRRPSPQGDGRRAQRPASPQGNSDGRRGQGPAGSANAGGKRDGRNNDSRRRDNVQPLRSSASRPSATRPQPAKPGNAEKGASGQGQRGSGAPGNPYSVPMEERMKLYKEKYGRTLDKESSGGSREPKAKEGHEASRSQQRGDRGAGQGSGQRKGPRDGKKGPAQRPQNQGGDRPAKVPQVQNPTQPMPAKPAPAEQEKKDKSVVSRLFGAFRKKKE